MLTKNKITLINWCLEIANSEEKYVVMITPNRAAVSGAEIIMITEIVSMSNNLAKLQQCTGQLFQRRMHLNVIRAKSAAT